MQVIATAGHVDHGKSALVRALTGMEPDRWAEEQRRGLTIDLGFAWMTLPGGERLAFVDVPGHERFVPTMLAGIYGPGRSAFDDLRAGRARRMIKPGHQFGRIHQIPVGSGRRQPCQPAAHHHGGRSLGQ